MSKKQFKAESRRLLDLMINSIYTHKEIFLREIISNASDAIDKINYKALTDTSIAIPKKELGIRISVDKEKRTITVSDNGIGMTKEEMDSNLGTIARSGSLEFKENMREDIDGSIIGQFGVGFYSAFMVSDKVTVISEAYGSGQAHKWESAGADGYTIEDCDRDSYGTDVIMHLKADTETDKYSEYLESYRIQDLIKKYSDYIHWPIHMDVESGKWVETGEKDDKGEPKKDYVTEMQDRVINSMVPIWQRDKKDVSEKDCFEFYKAKFHDRDDPAAVIRVNAEGVVTYKAMLFIPKTAPYDFYTRDYEPGLELYSSNVMIMEKCADVLPNCFRFVRGVVDSQDFSLNISREVLQHDSQLKSVSANLTKKIKAELENLMKNEPEKYGAFYKSFGRQLKYGVVEDFGINRDMLMDLLMFHSFDKNKLVSLSEYVGAMPKDQKSIYYVTADTVEHAKALPQTEQVREKGYDILCLVEDVDEFVMKTVEEYREKKVCNVTSDDLGLETEDEKKEIEAKEEGSKELLEFAKSTLGDKVSAVKISHKLKDHAVLLSSAGNVTLEMEKYFQNVPGSDDRMKASRVLELNSSHPAFKALETAFGADKDKAAKMVKIMYDQACITAGMPVDNTVEYSDLVFSLF